MGVCGCFDSSGMFSFPGPDGTIYTFDIYAGCRDCETPVGITLQAFRDTSLRDLRGWGIPPPVPWTEVETYRYLPLPLIDPAELAKDIVAEIGDLETVDASGESFRLSELFDVEPGALRNAIEKNMRRTVDEWVKARK